MSCESRWDPTLGVTVSTMHQVYATLHRCMLTVMPLVDPEVFPPPVILEVLCITAHDLLSLWWDTSDPTMACPRPSHEYGGTTHGIGRGVWQKIRGRSRHSVSGTEPSYLLATLWVQSGVLLLGVMMGRSTSPQMPYGSEEMRHPEGSTSLTHSDTKRIRVPPDPSRCPVSRDGILLWVSR